MKFYFAPMEGITGYIYRNTHHRYFPGVDQYFTPFIAPAKHHKLSSREKNDILPEHNFGVPVIPQLLTNRAEDFIWAAHELFGYGFGEVNLNLGCPSATVVSKQKGAGFLARTDDLDRFLNRVFTELCRDGIAVSVKTRIGMESPEEFGELMRIFNRYPLKELIIHPRIRSDFYKNKPNLEVFREGVLCGVNPVCYNGDIFSRTDWERFESEFPSDQFPQIGSVMLGRGALKNPGLFAQIRKKGGTDRKTLKAFHDELFDAYQEVMSGDRNTLFKMKELWFYMAGIFDDGAQYSRDKQIKKIKKAQKAEDYRRAAEELFEHCPLKDNGAGF